MANRRPVAFFALTEEDLSPENLDSTVDGIMSALAQRTHRGVGMDAFTDARDLDLITGSPTARVWRSLPIDPDAPRICPVCRGRLPYGSNLYRVYCGDRCRKRASHYRSAGSPTVWTKRCSRCGEWFESYHRAAKWCSDLCRASRWS